MNKEELFDRICQVSGFLRGYGDIAEIAANKLMVLLDEIDQRGLQSADPEPPEAALSAV